MKKAFFTLALMLVAFTGNAQTSPRGDLNGDGVVSISDVMELVSIVLHGDAPQAYLTCPDDHHPHLIDLGLPSGTKWACCNVDTDHPENQSPTNYGGHYAWGETETKSDYSESAYQYYKNGSYQSIGSDIAGTEYDVAHVKWSGSWVMPSKEQLDELRNNCTFTLTTQNGVSGILFTGTNGGSIFLPPAGIRRGSDFFGADTDGNYWSSTQDPSNAKGASYLIVYSYWLDGSTTYGGGRYLGFSVRPVSRN